MNLIKTEGIVLRSVKYSESDLILTVFARNLGKISVIVKGGRKNKSKYLASSQLFSLSEFTLRNMGNMYTIYQSENLKNRFLLTNDIESYSYASFISHLVDRNIIENHTNLRLFKVLDDTLDILGMKDVNKKYLICIFLLKFLDYTGYKPMVNQCVICASHQLNPVYFNTAEGGLICEACKGGYFNNIKIDPTLVKLMDYIYKTDITRAYNARVAPVLVSQLYFILIEYIKYHYDNINYKTLKVLSDLGL